MESYIDSEKQKQFLQDSAHAKKFSSGSKVETCSPPPMGKQEDTGANLEAIKEQIIKKVSNQTIDSINWQLLNENRLCLTETEKKYAEEQKTALLIKKGVNIKKEYKSLKELAEQERDMRESRIEREEELREEGLIGVNKRGKKYVIDIDNYVDPERLNSVTLNKKVNEIAKKFSDRRGIVRKGKGKFGDEGEHIVRSEMKKVRRGAKQ